MEFIYCDNIFSPLDPTSFTPRDLLRAAKLLGLTKLQYICDEMLSHTGSSLCRTGGVINTTTNLDKEILSALGNSVWADVIFIIKEDGRMIHAHRCILISRSEYFRAMLSGPMSEARQNTKAFYVDDSYLTMVRILTFIYSDTIATADEETLVRDLVAADRYGVVRMKRKMKI